MKIPFLIRHTSTGTYWDNTTREWFKDPRILYSGDERAIRALTTQMNKELENVEVIKLAHVGIHDDKSIIGRLKSFIYNKLM